ACFSFCFCLFSGGPLIDLFSLIAPRKDFAFALIPSSGYRDILMVGGGVRANAGDSILDPATYKNGIGDAWRYYRASDTWRQLCSNCGFGVRMYQIGTYIDAKTFVMSGGAP